MKIKINNQDYELNWRYTMGKLSHNGKQVTVPVTIGMIGNTKRTTAPDMKDPTKTILIVNFVPLVQERVYCSPENIFSKAIGRKLSLKALMDNMKSVKYGINLFHGVKDLKKERSNVWRQYRQVCNLDEKFNKVKQIKEG